MRRSTYEIVFVLIGLILFAIPWLAVKTVYCAAEEDFSGMLRALAFVFFLLTIVFTFFMYYDYLRRQRGLPSIYDRFDTEGIVMLKWVSLGAILFFASWLYRGVDFMITGLSPVNFQTSTLTEADREGWLATGLFVVSVTAAVLSILLPLLVCVCLELRSRKRLSEGE